MNCPEPSCYGYIMQEPLTWIDGTTVHSCSTGQHYYSDQLLKTLGDNMTKTKLAKTINDGVHEGTIVRVEERTEPYEYTDFIVDLDGTEIKDGCPTAISIDENNKPTTKLAKRLVTFGMELSVDKDVTVDDIREVCVGKAVTIMTENETTEKGTFAKVVSLKPSENQPAEKPSEGGQEVD